MSQFTKVSEREWTAETANYTAVVTRNGHCGYWMVLTNKATGAKSGKLYGKHFKALASWFPIYEKGRKPQMSLVPAASVETEVAETTEITSESIEYSNCSKTQAELEAQCPDFHNLPSEWIDFIESHMDVCEKAA